MMDRPQGLALTLASAMTLTLALGCDKSPKKEEVPKTPEGRIEQMATRLPNTTEAALFVSDFEKTRTALEDLKKRVGDVFPIEQVEKEVKKETGVDLFNPESYKKAGIAPNAGLGVASVGGRAIVMTYIDNRQAFEKVVGEQLKKQVGEQAVIKSKKEGEVELKFVGDKPAQRIAWTYWGKMAIFATPLIEPGPQPEGEDVIFKTLVGLTTTKAEASASSTAAFKGFKAAMAKDWPVAAYADPKALINSKTLGIKANTKGDKQAEQAVSWFEKNAKWLGFGARMVGQKLETRSYFVPNDTLAKDVAGLKLDGVKSMAPNFASDKTIAGVRTGFNFGNAWALLRKTLSKEQNDELTAGFKNMSGGLGMDVEKEVLGNLSGDIGIYVLGANVPALMAASSNPMEITKNLSVAITIHTKDAKKLDALVNKLRERSGGLLTSSKNGDVQVLEGKGPNETPVGTIFVKGNSVVLATAALNKDNVLAMINGKSQGKKLADAAGMDLGKSFASEKPYNGLYVNFSAVSAALAGLAGMMPPSASQILKELTEASVSFDNDKTGLFVNFSLHTKKAQQ